MLSEFTPKAERFPPQRSVAGLDWFSIDFIAFNWMRLQWFGLCYAGVKCHERHVYVLVGLNFISGYLCDGRYYIMFKWKGPGWKIITK